MVSTQTLTLEIYMHNVLGKRVGQNARVTRLTSSSRIFLRNKVW